MQKAAISIILLLALLAACKKKVPERAYYYWKTKFTLTPADGQLLRSLHINKLYIRFFDVDWEESKGEAIPKGKINFASPTEKGLDIVPVVYITNKTFLHTKGKDIGVLAEKVFNQMNIIAGKNSIVYKEMQFDCDWTESTRASYFNFINEIKQLSGNCTLTLSATIRLHQVKYYKITGVPPVDRGMLMYYNMGKIDTSATNNSIFNTNDAGKYIDHIDSYPLPMDIVLPTFSWGILIRGGKVINLLSSLSLGDFKNNCNFIPVCNNQYKVRQSFFYKGFYLMENDLVKVEQTTPELCKLAAMQVAKKMKHPALVAFYHLDSLNYTNYEPKDFEEIFNYFR
jgi:hypothetical protein